jgi:O-antigen/teichoic acid export membrane protein
MKVFKNVYIYFGSYFFNAGFSFLTVSLLTRYLTPYDYGVINLYSSFLILFMPFISGGIISPLSVQFYKKSPEEYRKFFTDAQAITSASLVFLTIVCFFLREPLSRFLRVTPIWITILPITVWWVMINEIMMTMCRMKHKAWSFAFFSTGKNIAETVLTILLVIGLHWAWQGRLFSAVAAPAMLGIVSIFILYKWQFIGNSVNWTHVKQIAWISSPFIFERLSIFVLNNSDRYFIDRYDLNGTHGVGLYSAGAQVASIINLVILSINSAYLPYLFQHISANNKAKAKRGTGLYIIGAAVMVGAVFLGIPILFKYFIGKQFSDGSIYAYYLSGGNFMWAIYNAFVGYLLFYGKNRAIFYISLAGMIISLVLNYILVPRYGAYGAAITSIATYSFMAVICFRAAWKYFKS